MSRLHRQRSSRSHKEALDLDFEIMFGTGIHCLPAHLGADTYQSYLIVMPGSILATLYEKYGARLLEQNVRTFLQARGKVSDLPAASRSRRARSSGDRRSENGA